jgi:CheY-like chemotaxis protein
MRLRVLAGDDNRDAADTTAELLRICGADAEVRYGGEGARADLAALRPDACVLDLTMPGMDGCDLAGRIRALGGRQPLFVALTALGDAATRDRAAACGFDLHFTKPVDPAALLHALGEHMYLLTRKMTIRPHPAAALLHALGEHMYRLTGPV